MKNVLKVDFTKRKIIMDRTFARLVEDTSSSEYDQLQRVRQDYPNYKVEQKHIHTNPNKKTYCGLTYDYMEGYILAHGTTELAKEFYSMREISECQGKAQRYPVIKSWFLDKFPEIVRFGIEVDASDVSPVKVIGKANADTGNTQNESENEDNIVLSQAC